MKQETLISVFDRKRNLENVGISFVNGVNDEEFISYKALYVIALEILHSLQRKGIKPKSELVFQIEDNKTFIQLFWACIMGGIIPVPVAVGKSDAHRSKFFNIWDSLNNPSLITSSKIFGDIGSYANENGHDSTFLHMEKTVMFVSEVHSPGQSGEVYNVDENDIAFLQFSSGSTGLPKGVVLTHKNLVANLEGISTAAGYSEKDSMLSWMPLTHDMGLIGFHLNPLYSGINQFIMPTNLFVRRPSLWIDKSSQHNISILCSPNFGYQYVLRHVKEGNSSWDLSNVRIIYNGAEPISDRLVKKFELRFEEYGLNPRALCPVYGLAEASLAVTISNLDADVLAIKVDRSHVDFGDRIKIAEEDANSVSFVNVGKEIKHCLLRVTDHENEPYSDARIGKIQISGSNVTTGYYNNQEQTDKTITADGWLDTGDLGFILDGCLFVTGRIKDIIFANGQNFYPHDIEGVAQEVEGIELNKIAVGSFFNPDSQKQEVIAFVFHRGALVNFLPVLTKLRSCINLNFGVLFDVILPVKNIPRTTSGKLQRFQLLEQYRNQEFSQIAKEINNLEIDYANGQTEKDQQLTNLEKELHEIWCEVLNINTIGLTDDFFEIGGNSLLAAAITMKCQKQFQVDFEPELLYSHRSIKSLSEKISYLEQKAFVPIPKVEDGVSGICSGTQARLYFAWKNDTSTSQYSIPTAFELAGDIDVEKLEQSIKSVVQRHEALWMNFHMDKQVKFSVNALRSFEIGKTDCDAEAVDQTLKGLVQPFDLSTDLLFRFNIITTTAKNLYLYTDFHHIISDGLSVYYLLEEIMKVYKGEILKPLETSFQDFLEWHSKETQQNDRTFLKNYWLEKFDGEWPLLELPTDSARPVLFNAQGAKVTFEIDQERTTKLNEIANRCDVNMHAVLFSLYNVLISKYSGSDELVIGIPVSGRRHHDLEGVQGMFVNNLAIRTKLEAGFSFKEIIEYVSSTLKGALDHQDFLFDELVELNQNQRIPGRNPVFDTMFNFQNMGMPQVDGLDISFSRHAFDTGFSKFDLSMEVFEEDNKMSYAFEYSESFFTSESIRRLADYFNHLIHCVIQDVEQGFSDLTLLNDKQHALEIYDFNSSHRAYNVPTILDLFEKQVIDTPEGVAITFNGRSLTYQELNEEANRIANACLVNGVSSNKLVGLYCPRSMAFVVSVLGVLKAGGAYLPIDVLLPAERISYLISDSQCVFVITSNVENEELSADTPCYDFQDLLNDSSCILDHEIVVKPEDLAYVIYTSGTTGSPKGVMIGHESLSNYVQWSSEEYLDGEKAVFPLYSSISFDLTITSIFTPLCTGNRVEIYGEEDLAIEQVIIENKVDIVKLTPSHLKLLRDNKLLNSNSRIKKFIVGGEALETQLANDIVSLMNPDVRIFNEYGPTEATVGCMIHEFDRLDTSIQVPIGIPAANTSIYLLDKYLKPVPRGLKGEIHISGKGLAKGYLNRTTLNDERFISNPFVDGQLMYVSGDMGMKLSDGKIMFLGRTDNQVKINGYRIELLEIENYLLGHQGISQVAVIQKSMDDGKERLLAYCTRANESTSSFELQEKDMKAYLAQFLPYYSIPFRIIFIDQIPLNKNGKIDVSRLDDFQMSIPQHHVSESISDMEKVYLKVWEELFSTEKISVKDNFFELGGDSIKAVQVVSKMNQRGFEVDAKVILTHHTIEQIAKRTNRFDGKILYDQGKIRGEVTPNPIQSWFLSQDFQNPHYFNQSVFLTMNKSITASMVEHALTHLVEHHDSLRLNYNQGRNVLCYSLNFSIEVEEYLAKSEERYIDLCEQSRRKIDLSNDSLIRAILFSDPEGNQKLFITAHHIVVDGVSWRILLEDLTNILTKLSFKEALILPSKTASLQDWNKKYQDYLNSDQGKENSNYWRSRKSSNFKIPLDFETKDWSARNSGKVKGALDSEQTNYLLKNASNKYNTDVSVLLNVALLLTLKEWTGLDDFIIEHENHGRHLEGIDVSRTVGWFTAMYPVGFNFVPEISELIKQTKEQMKMIPADGIGFDSTKYSSFGSQEEKCSEIRINYLGQFGKELDNDWFSFCSEYTGLEQDPDNALTTRLELNLMVLNESLNLEINYNKSAHKLETVEFLTECFFRHLSAVLAHLKGDSEVHFTPSDFQAADLNQQELDALFT